MTYPAERSSAGLAVPPPARGPVSVRIPDRLPWSVLGPHFQHDWGRFDPSDPQPEHVEVTGPNGSGKSYLICTMMADRVAQRGTATIAVVTKEADETLLKLGWPIAQTVDEVRRHRQAVFWPSTDATGTARKVFQEKRIRELLETLWMPNANVLVQFDEVGYIESLSRELRELVGMYWREGRSHGITVMAGKQRPQGTQREMHSESWWKASFQPADESDMERVAELYGPKRLWMEVLRNLRQDRREFLIRHTRTGQSFISWVDTPLRPRPRHPDGAGTAIWTRGKRATSER